MDLGSIPPIKGADLCECFFNDVARPIIGKFFPGLRYSAGLIGWGSDVLGYDDTMSTDHMWGPRFQLFLTELDYHNREKEISRVFAERLPYQYKGFSTHFGQPDADDNGTRLREPIKTGCVDPLIDIYTLENYFELNLGWKTSEEISIPQWLTFSEYSLLGLTSGRVYHDDLGLELIRKKISYYPRDIWIWLLASQWKMLAEEEPLVGRCGYYGDDIGSRLVAARQVQRLMRLGFLMEKRYAPYSKWLGTAYKELETAPELLPLLETVLTAGTWSERDELLARVYTVMAERHNTLGLTEVLETHTQNFFNRPFHVLYAERFASALVSQIENPELRSIPLIGSVTQLTDSVALYDDISLGKKMRNLYD